MILVLAQISGMSYPYMWPSINISTSGKISIKFSMRLQLKAVRHFDFQLYWHIINSTLFETTHGIFSCVFKLLIKFYKQIWNKLIELHELCLEICVVHHRTNNAIGRVIRPQVGWRSSCSLIPSKGHEILIWSQASRPALGPAQQPFQWVPALK